MRPQLPGLARAAAGVGSRAAQRNDDRASAFALRRGRVVLRAATLHGGGGAVRVVAASCAVAAECGDGIAATLETPTRGDRRPSKRDGRRTIEWPSVNRRWRPRRRPGDLGTITSSSAGGESRRGSALITGFVARRPRLAEARCGPTFDACPPGYQSDVPRLGDGRHQRPCPSRSWYRRGAHS